MTTTIEAYIGSNNHTHLLEMDKIKAVLARNHQGFTIKGVVTGFWRGQEEAAAVVLLSDEVEAIARTLRELKVELNQDTIATVRVSDMQYI